MKVALSLSLALALVGCSFSDPAHVTSSRSLDLPPERFAKGGSVCVMTDAKLNRTYPKEQEQVVARAAEAGFSAKGFQPVERPAGAAYGFLFAVVTAERPASSATTIGDTVYLNRVRVRSVAGQFYSLRPDGRPEKLLWEGEARAGGYRFDDSTVNPALMGKLMAQFPN